MRGFQKQAPALVRNHRAGTRPADQVARAGTEDYGVSPSSSTTREGDEARRRGHEELRKRVARIQATRMGTKPSRAWKTE